MKKFIEVFVIILGLFLPLYALGAAIITPPSGWPVTETQDLIVHNSSQESNVTATTFSAATANITTETVGSSAINSLQSVAITANTASITSSTINTTNITNATIATENVTTSTINSLQASAITATALSANVYTTTVGGVDFSTPVGGYYITNNGGQNFVNFKNPSTPTPTTYSYNTITTTVPSTSGNGLTFTVYSSDLNPNSYYNKLQISPSFFSGSETGFIFSLMRTGNLVQYGIANAGGDIYLNPYSNNGLTRVVYGGHPLILYNSYSGTNSFVAVDSTLSFTVASGSNINSSLGITIATNAGQGIYTLTQNNAIMNTGPIYPRNPANVAQTLTQPTIQPVYNNNLAGLSYTGWSVTGSGNLVNGVLTVNLGLPFDNVNAYRCSANYDGVPTTVAGFLVITKNSGSQFVITSVNSTGGTNTTDANKVQWVCIGY